MRTTLALDDELLAKAQAFTGLREKSALVREALTALIERESSRRLREPRRKRRDGREAPPAGDPARNDPCRHVDLGRSLSTQ